MTVFTYVLIILIRETIDWDVSQKIIIMDHGKKYTVKAKFLQTKERIREPKQTVILAGILEITYQKMNIYWRRLYGISDEFRKSKQGNNLSSC